MVTFVKKKTKTISHRFHQIQNTTAKALPQKFDHRPSLNMTDTDILHQSVRVAIDNRAQSKHLKGQLDPPVSNVTFFAPKEVSWTPL